MSPPMAMRIGLLVLPLCFAASAPAQPDHLVLDRAETAGIDGREWDKAFPGALTVDAVHRSVLLRFPGAAPAISARLEGGFAVDRAEVVLDFDGTEIAPPGYAVRNALGERKWRESPPKWHVSTVPLRRPWRADPKIGPTFNAFINGAGYWGKYGAADTGTDRFGITFPPAELSLSSPEARIDITSLLTGPEFGSAGERLRLIEESGLLLKKVETYDVRYRDTWEAYEWAVPTGGHGLRFRNPRLFVTFKPANRTPLMLPSAIDVVAVAQSFRRDGSGGEPTAVMPSKQAFKSLAERAAPKRPEGMSDWQFQRVRELYRIGGDSVSAWAKAVEAGDHKHYERLLRDMLSTPPRHWKGFSVQDDLLAWYLYRDLLPAYVQDHLRNYWTAWLMPDIPTSELFHPQSQEAADYWTRTKDWRGRTSFFRDGYNYVTSTQNFNHVAAMGALLGGEMIGSNLAMADGRHGLEHFPLRLWSMNDGSTQEMLDHYYFSITLSAQKMFADFGPTQLDRLMGRIILDRSIEMLATAYHPDLRRFVSPSGRARLSGVLVEQEGIHSALHTLSKRGTLKYLDMPMGAKVHGLPVWGNDFPPGRVAIQSLPGKWAPDWMSNIVDGKQFPFEETSTETTRGKFNPPLWRRMYLGRHYGLASQDVKGGTVDLLAQWNSRDVPSTTMDDLGTLTLRYAVNDADMASTQGGTMPYAGGMLTFQHRNRAIVCTKPRTEKERVIALAGKDGLKSLSSVIALWNFRAEPGWEIFVDGNRLTRFPAKLRGGQTITIKDGVTYLAIMPIPATDLGRNEEVVIGFGGEGASELYQALKPALTITSYNLKSDTPIPSHSLDWSTINTATYGGFVIEIGDASEYRDFSAFSAYTRANKLTSRWEARSKLLHVEYRSGPDLLEMGCATDYAQADVHSALMPGQQVKAMPYRRVNGAWPYLPTGVDRDTTLAQQGTSGRLEKNGAVLLTEKGRMAYLQTEPQSGTFVGYNPLPDPTMWSLSVPGGVTVRADGKVSLLRVEVVPGTNHLSLDYAVRAGQTGPEMARRLLVTGLDAPKVERNGQPLGGPFGTTRENGRTVYAIPLMD